MLFHPSLSIAGCLAALAGSVRAAGDSWTGTWQGGLRFASEWHAARVDFEASDGRTVGRLDVPALGAVDRPIELFVEEGRVHLVLELEDVGRKDIVLVSEPGALRTAPGGSWSSPALHLVATAAAPAADLDAYAGWYAFAPGSDALVTRGSEGGLRCFGGGSCVTLIPIARDRFAAVYEDTDPDPTRGEARFVRDAAGAIDAFESTRGEQRTIAKRERDHPTEITAVRFRSGALELAGILLRPKAEPLAPAVVFLAGTGYSCADRLYEMTLARRLLARRIAVLLFDKRGCGGSGGNWRTSSLADLACDAVAAVGFLRASRKARPDAIGVWGVSEGGWVAPLAAAKSSDVAFLVDHGGPAVSPLEDELDDLMLGIRSVGFAGEDLEIATTLAAALVDFYGSPQAKPAFEAALAPAKLRPWWKQFQARIPQREDDWRVQWWRKRGELDSVAVWKKLRTPALVLIGGEDATMDRPKNLALYESFRSDHPRLEIRVVPGADHGLRVGGEVVPGVVEGVADWIETAIAR